MNPQKQNAVVIIKAFKFCVTAYYQQVASRTRADFDNPNEKQVHPEQARLTDDWALESQTNMDGDLFMWYKFQAEQGELFAQVRCPRQKIDSLDDNVSFLNNRDSILVFTIFNLFLICALSLLLFVISSTGGESVNVLLHYQ